MAISYARVNADNAMATRETTNIALGTNMEFQGRVNVVFIAVSLDCCAFYDKADCAMGFEWISG